MLKNLKFFIRSGLVILLAGILNPLALAKNTTSLDGIVAIVNDSVITQSELNQTMNGIKKQLRASNVSAPEPKIFRKQVLDQLILKKLQSQVAEAMGIKVTDEDVNKAIKMIADNNKLSVNELYEKLAEQDIKRSEYEKEIREQLLLQKVQQQAIASKINITPQEVDDFMRSKSWQAFNNKEYHLEDILITLPETPSPSDVQDAKKQAEALLNKIQNGLSFKEAAVASSGEKNALQGGDLGWKKLPEIPAIFANDLIHMKTNQLLGPVQTPNGFHIVRLAGIRNTESHLTTAQQHQQVQQLIFQRKIEENLQSWTTKLRSEAFINIPDA